ncbi:MAG: class I SAM-dependent methyltransferase [Planctomycetota bacterium]
MGLTAMRREQGSTCSAWCARTRRGARSETGFAFGASGLHMVLKAIEGGAAEPVHVAMDPFQSKFWGNAGVESFRRAGVIECLTMYEESSSFRLPELIRAGTEPFDLALVDGAHLFENAFIDIYYLSQLVRPGGLLVVDDVWMPGVRWAMDYFVKNLGWKQHSQYPPQPYQVKRRFRPTPPLSGVNQVVFQMGDAPKRNWDHFVPFGDKDGPLEFAQP